MRRQVIAQDASSCWYVVRHRLAQLLHLAQQQVNLLLLTCNDFVQLFDQVLGVSRLDFKIGQSLVCDVCFNHVGRFTYSLLIQELPTLVFIRLEA